jgi:hypothetical protein
MSSFTQTRSRVLCTSPNTAARDGEPGSNSGTPAKQLAAGEAAREATSGEPEPAYGCVDWYL